MVAAIVLTSERLEVLLIELTSLNRGEGLLDMSTHKVEGKSEGKGGGGEIVVVVEGERNQL